MGGIAEELATAFTENPKLIDSLLEHRRTTQEFVEEVGAEEAQRWSQAVRRGFDALRVEHQRNGSGRRSSISLYADALASLSAPYDVRATLFKLGLIEFDLAKAGLWFS